MQPSLAQTVTLREVWACAMYDFAYSGYTTGQTIRYARNYCDLRRFLICTVFNQAGIQTVIALTLCGWIVMVRRRSGDVLGRRQPLRESAWAPANPPSGCLWGC